MINLIKKKMEPLFISYNNLSFDQNKKFTLEFSDRDLLEDVNFQKKKTEELLYN